jgi:hypothetical protein
MPNGRYPLQLGRCEAGSGIGFSVRLSASFRRLECDARGKAAVLIKRGAEKKMSRAAIAKSELAGDFVADALFGPCSNSCQI